MWFTALDIVSTAGGHAGMQSSQPLQCSTSIVTVPRLLIVCVSASDAFMGRLHALLPFGRSAVVSCFRPRRERAGWEQLPARPDRAAVGFDVLRPVRRDRRAHGVDESIDADDAGD